MKKRKSCLRRGLAAALSAVCLLGILVGQGAQARVAECTVCAASVEDIFGVVRLNKKEAPASRPYLIPGGDVIGMRMIAGGVLVVGMAEVVSEGKGCCPARDVGLREKDIILKAGGRTVSSSSQLSEMIEGAGGGPITLLCRRGEQEFTVELLPVRADKDGKYRSGLWVKDTTSGIGTVTFVHPKTGEFGALGHGICERESGALMPLSRGVVTDAVIRGVEKGKEGDPGEICGSLGTQKRGSMIKNCGCGVFGVMCEIPTGAPLPIGFANEVHKGTAVIRSTLDGGGVKEYTVEITEIHRKSETKCFSIRVTDEALLAKTGGIVQGMSGSPIIQDGRLVGAVTHVLVANPTEGYGIFIENMLNAAQSEVIPKAA